MESKRLPVEDHSDSSARSCAEPDRLFESGLHERTASQNIACMEELLAAHPSVCRDNPLTAEELLAIGSKTLEPLFHGPPLGPVPEYLVPHLSVHGCVAEYEEKLGELDRWKARELSRWLNDRAGSVWKIGGKLYELRAERPEGAASERFWLKFIPCSTERETSPPNEDWRHGSAVGPSGFDDANEGVAMAQAKQGDTVRVHYVGTLEDGTVFSSTYEEKEPFEFVIGKEGVLPKFADAVIGLNEGEKRTISIPPEDAYGEHRKEFVFAMQRSQAPASLELEVGKRLHVRLQGGATAVATVQAMSEDTVILDANDPLAGKTLKFEIELMKIL